MLAGRLRDPLIGRDILIGGVVGVVGVLVVRLQFVLPQWLGLPAIEPISGEIGGYPDGAVTALEGLPQAIGMIAHLPALTLSSTLAGIFMLVLFRVLLRKPGLTVTALIVLLFAASLTMMTQPLVEAPLALINVLLLVGVLVRYGLLASGVYTLMSYIDPLAMLTPDLTVWYAGRSWLLLLLVAALFGYALWISMGGKARAGLPPG